MGLTEKRSQSRRLVFEAALGTGIEAAGKAIVGAARKLAQSLEGAPVGQLAQNLSDTMQVFVTDRVPSDLLRYGQLASKISKLVADEKVKTFTFLDSTKKLKQIGEGFGFMCGTAVLTSTAHVFIGQAHSKLEQAELSDQEKKLCKSFIDDAFNLIIMTLTQKLTSDYKTTPKDRVLFSELLLSNDWMDLDPVVKE